MSRNKYVNSVYLSCIDDWASVKSVDMSFWISVFDENTHGDAIYLTALVLPYHIEEHPALFLNLRQLQQRITADPLPVVQPRFDH